MITFVKKINRLILILSFLALLIPSVFAVDFDKDLYISDADVRADQNILKGDTARIYVKVHNGSAVDLTGVVKVYNERSATYIGSDQPISILSGETDDVFIDWTPDLTGEHLISVRILPWSEGDNPDNNKVTKTFVVDIDSDGDGIGDRLDPDDDNDGVNDNQDALPYDPSESEDTDGDGIGNNIDEDDDNDGVSDIKDAFPLDSTESKDTDKDGVGDTKDAFPFDSTETMDSDSDGLGDNSDPNDSNKGPIPNIDVVKTDVRVNEVITFNALKTRDEDGEPVLFEWNFGDGNTAEGILIDHNFKKPGDYYVTLRVTDDKDEYREQQIQIRVHLDWQWIVLIVLAVLLLVLLANLFRPSSRFHHKKIFSSDS